MKRLVVVLLVLMISILAACEKIDTPNEQVGNAPVFNDMDDLELPKVERKPEPKKVIDTIAYFVNDEPSTKEGVEAIDSERIESVNVIKDSIQLKTLNTQNNTFYTGIIEVKLKDE